MAVRAPQITPEERNDKAMSLTTLPEESSDEWTGDEDFFPRRRSNALTAEIPAVPEEGEFAGCRAVGPSRLDYRRHLDSSHTIGIPPLVRPATVIEHPASAFDYRPHGPSSQPSEWRGTPSRFTSARWLPLPISNGPGHTPETRLMPSPSWTAATTSTNVSDAVYDEHSPVRPVDSVAASPTKSNTSAKRSRTSKDETRAEVSSASVTPDASDTKQPPLAAGDASSDADDEQSVGSGDLSPLSRFVKIGRGHKRRG